MAKIDVTVDWKRAEKVLGTLVAAYRNNDFPYSLSNVYAPQRRLPESLGEDGRIYAFFLFCLCYYMRGSIKSRTAAAALARLYENHREPLFVPEQVVNCTAEEVSTRLKEHGLGFASLQTGGFWIENAEHLLEHYGGDVRRIFEGVDSYRMAVDRILSPAARKNGQAKDRGFYGFQYKMTSMLIYFLIDLKLITPFPFPSPIDFHFLRIFFGTEMFITTSPPETDLRTQESQALARNITIRFAHKHGIDQREIVDAVWLFSESLCSRNLGNRSQIAKVRSGRSTPIKAKPIQWTRSQIKTYEEVCRVCPIRLSCVWNVPSGPYYVSGKLVRRGHREHPPQGYLFP